MDRTNFDKATDAEKDLEAVEAAALKEAEQQVEAVDGDGNREQDAAEAAETAAMFAEAEKNTADLEAEVEGNFVDQSLSNSYKVCLSKPRS